MDRKLLNSEGSEFSITSRTQLLCETSRRGTVLHTSVCVPAVRSLPLSYSPDSTAIRIVLGQYCLDYHVVKLLGQAFRCHLYGLSILSLESRSGVITDQLILLVRLRVSIPGRRTHLTRAMRPSSHLMLTRPGPALREVPMRPTATTTFTTTALTTITHYHYNYDKRRTTERDSGVGVSYAHFFSFLFSLLILLLRGVLSLPFRRDAELPIASKR